MDRVCLSDRENLQTYLERKAESAVRGGNAAQKRPSEADLRYGDQKKRSEMALCEIHRELEPQRLELHQANQQADQPQREKISLCGELELRNRLFQENHA